LDVRDLKRRWLAAVEQAHRLVESLPEEDLGCLYLREEGTPVTPDPTSDRFVKLSRHFGCVRGAWPSIASHQQSPPRS